MQYQLPNGKVIHMSVEEYLSLTDRDLHELANSGYGSDPSHHMYYGKKAKKKAKEPEEESEEEEASLDYVPDIEETDTRGPIDLNSIPDD